jgi:dUTP pyrophosphatase
VLSGDEIRRHGLVRLSGPSAEPAHIQPSGVDLSLDAVWRFRGAGALGISDDSRHLPDHDELAFDSAGWVELTPGTYGILYAEWVELPVDRGGLCFPRSSLLRMGAHVPTAVWDAGYAGRGEGLLHVGNPHGVRLQRGARIAQLVVFQLTEPASEGYAGRYQNEHAQ